MGVKMSIGERITELRAEKKLSQYQLAELMEVSRQAVSKWESDQSSPDTIRLIKLAEVLDTEVEYLATGRRTYGRRPPVVVQTVKTVEKVVEKPIYIEKTLEKEVEKPVIQYIEKPVIQYRDRPVVKKVYRTRYVRDPMALTITGIVCFLLGAVIGWLL